MNYLDDAARIETRARVLNTWKEIACYVNRGVRTVQRWECDLDFPVHRVGTGPRGPVIAFPDEVDGWLRSRNGSHYHVVQPVRRQLAQPLTPERHPDAVPPIPPALTRLFESLGLLRSSLKELRATVSEVRKGKSQWTFQSRPWLSPQFSPPRSASNDQPVMISPQTRSHDGSSGRAASLPALASQQH